MLQEIALLRREYLSLGINALKNNPSILHISQRDFLGPNCLHRDQ